MDQSGETILRLRSENSRLRAEVETYTGVKRLDAMKFPYRPPRPEAYPPGSVLLTDALVREICDNLGLSPALRAAVVERVDAWEGEMNTVVGTTGLPGNLYKNRDQAVLVVVDALRNLGR